MKNIVKLSKVVKQIRGVSYSPEDISSTLNDESISLLRATNINKDYSIDRLNLIYVSKNKVKKEQYLQTGDILIAGSSGSIDVVGKAANYEGIDEITFGAFCKVIRPNQKIANPKYIGFFFQTDYYRKRISFLAQGANINNLRNEHLDDLDIPLPDLETQNKIVAILDKAKGILDKREKTIVKYDELLRGIFIEMFGNPMERPNRWKIDKIGKCIKAISAGTSFGGEDKKELEDDELGVLKISAVTKGIFNPKEYKAVKKELIKKQILKPQKGDLLFSRANTLELVGATCIVDEDYEKLFLPDKIWRIETNELLIKKVFLHYVLQNKDVRKTFLSIATGSSGSMLNISMEKFKNIEIPFPTIELQEQFVAKYDKYKKLKLKIYKSKENLEVLKKSISQLAFKGKLTFSKAIDLEVLLENDYEFFKENSNTKSIQLLLERLDKDELNEKKFFEQKIYDKAKGFVFELLKEGKVKQVFDEKTKRVKLTF